MSPAPIRVLYVHHTGALGGASRSLLELIEGFPAGSVSPRLVTQRGGVGGLFAGRGAEVIETAGISQFDNTRYGRYSGKRWLLLLREAFYLPFTFRALLCAWFRWRDIDLVHVNEVVAVPAILLSRLLFRCPLIVHVRSVQDARRNTLRSLFLSYVLRRHADAVIAIDETVRRSLPADLDADVIHNGYTPRIDSDDATRDGTMPPRRGGALRVAMVGNLLALKGVREFLHAARLCHERGLAIEFVIVGSNTRRLSGLVGRLLQSAGFAHDMEKEVDRYVAEHGLQGSVLRVPFTRNIDGIYRNIDVVCFPSHLDAPGRPVFEAAWWEVPSIVALTTPAPDTVVHQVSGICVAPGDVAALAGAIDYCARNPDAVRRMGKAARELALANFDARKNAARVLEIYRRLRERAVTARQPA